VHFQELIMLKFLDLRVLPILGAAIVAASPVYADDEATAKGEGAFNNACRTCHSAKPGENRLGPGLAGVTGRQAGIADGFSYSPAMKSAGVTWDEKTLDAFIANPDAVVPGSNMKPYTGISDAEVRASIVAYLRTK
jgi:cytochrome c